jgi:hypothetical protein
VGGVELESSQLRSSCRSSVDMVVVGAEGKSPRLTRIWQLDLALVREAAGASATVSRGHGEACLDVIVVKVEVERGRQRGVFLSQIMHCVCGALALRHEACGQGALSRSAQVSAAKMT